MKTASRLSVFTFAVALSGQTPPKDVTGWDKIKWGITLTDVRTAYNLPATAKEWPGAAAHCGDYPIAYCLPDRGPYIGIDPIEIGTIKMTDITVQAGYGSTKVVSVQLADFAGATGRGNGISDFDTLKTLLIQKYGSPANQETKRDDIGASVTTVLWTFPSTSILLSLRERSVIYLEYKATDKKALDKL
jgi:hypothetical protein